MPFARAVDRLLAPAERLVTALTDPVRRERTVALVLLAYVLLWALYGAIAKSSQDIHFDMGEAVAWSRELDWGYAKHPPLSAWLVYLWFRVFPLADGSYYLFAMVLATLSLWMAWKLAARYLDADKRVVGLALLTFIPFFNFHALKFNANTVMIPFWAATTWFFLRSLETRSIVYAGLAGVAAGFAMLGKYWSVMLLAGLVVAAFVDPHRKQYFRSAAPWVTIGCGALVLMPHLIWLWARDFAPLLYAATSHELPTRWAAAETGLGYVAGAAGYAALPAIVALLLARPSRAALADTLRPAEPVRRIALVAFVLPIVLPLFAAIAATSQAVSLWALASMTLLPVVLLSSPLVKIPRTAVVHVVAAAVALPVVMVLLSPAIAYVIHERGVPKGSVHYRQLAAAIEQAWRAATSRPLHFVGGDSVLAFGTAFYLSDQPLAFTEFDVRARPAIEHERVARDGIAMACFASDRGCIDMIRPRETTSGAVRRSEVEIERSFFGVPGKPERYLIVIVPPR